MAVASTAEPLRPAMLRGICAVHDVHVVHVLMTVWLPVVSVSEWG